MHVYIAHSEELNKYFTGITSLRQKQTGGEGDAKATWTSGTGVWQAVWTTEVPDIEAARVLQKKIRTDGARRFLEIRGVAVRP